MAGQTFTGPTWLSYEGVYEGYDMKLTPSGIKKGLRKHQRVVANERSEFEKNNPGEEYRTQTESVIPTQILRELDTGSKKLSDTGTVSGLVPYGIKKIAKGYLIGPDNASFSTGEIVGPLSEPLFIKTRAKESFEYLREALRPKAGDCDGTTTRRSMEIHRAVSPEEYSDPPQMQKPHNKQPNTTNDSGGDLGVKYGDDEGGVNVAGELLNDGDDVFISQIVEEGFSIRVGGLVDTDYHELSNAAVRDYKKARKELLTEKANCEITGDTDRIIHIDDTIAEIDEILERNKYGIKEPSTLAPRALKAVSTGIERALETIEESSGEGKKLADFIRERLRYTSDPIQYTPRAGDPPWRFK